MSVAQKVGNKGAEVWVGGVSYRALLGKCTHEKAAVEGEKGFALRRDQNKGEKPG